MIYSYKSNILRKRLKIKLPFSKYVQTPRKQIENHNKLTDIYTMLFFPVQTLSDTYSDYNRYNSPSRRIFHCLVLQKIFKKSLTVKPQRKPAVGTDRILREGSYISRAH